MSHDASNRKLEIYTAPTKAKWKEPAYSQGLNQSKIDKQRSKFKESVNNAILSSK